MKKNKAPYHVILDSTERIYANVCRKRAWMNRCPRCGQGRILKNLFRRYESCSHCGLKYAREDGFFSAALPINYTLVSVFWLGPLLLLWSFSLISGWLTFILAVIGATLLPILLYRYSQCLWLGTYYYFTAGNIDKTDEIREHEEDPPV